MIEYKINYCKKCGGQIDNRTKICMSCGKQYMTKAKLYGIIVSIVCVFLISLLIYQKIIFDKHESDYIAFAQQEQEIDQEFVDRFGDCANPITGEAVTNDQTYIEAYDAQVKSESEQEATEESTEEATEEAPLLNPNYMSEEKTEKLRWYEDNIRIVSSSSSEYYHKNIFCTLCDMSNAIPYPVDSPALDSYQPCPVCCAQ